MVDRQPSGTRIREHRQRQGLRQTELAAGVGISASYLNLIEHGRRRIGGKLLGDIARALDLEPGSLSEAPDIGRFHALRGAARGSAARPPPELDQAQEFSDRFPGWAALVIQQGRRTEALEARLAELAARLHHDQPLAQSLHQILTAITAIRSAAGILTEDPDLDRDWQARFLGNILRDSEALADAARTLIRVLEVPEAAAFRPSPQEEAERWLQDRDHHLPEIEAGLPLSDVPEGAAGDALRAWAIRYARDAAALPLGPFAQAAKEEDFDPARLASRFGASPARILRRLASLPPKGPAFGLVLCDASGTVTHLRPIEGFPAIREGACPLWPLFEAFASPGQGLRAHAALPGDGAPRFLCHAVAAPVEDAGWGTPPRLEGTMLIRPAAPDADSGDRQVGPTCRLCPRTACPARREPSILG